LLSGTRSVFARLGAASGRHGRASEACGNIKNKSFKKKLTQE